MPTTKTGSSSRTGTKKPVKKSTRLSTRVRKERSYRQMVGRIDVWSVLKVSLCFYTASMLVTVVAMIVCWWVASAVGLVKNFEKFLGTVFEIEKFSFVDFGVLQGVLMIGFVFVAIMTIISVLAASLYNIFAEAVGGIEIYVVEETAGAKI